MAVVPVIVDDRGEMAVRVVEAEYMDFGNIEVAPSEGDFPRTIDPSTVPYTYGDCYSRDAFFPGKDVELREPYIIRDFRGQNVVFYPFQYSGASKTLRGYYNVTVEVYKTGENGHNELQGSRRGGAKSTLTLTIFTGVTLSITSRRKRLWREPPSTPQFPRTAICSLSATMPSSTL